MFVFSGHKPYPDGITLEILFQELNIIAVLVSILILIMFTAAWAFGLYKLDQISKKKETPPLPFFSTVILWNAAFVAIVFSLGAIVATRLHFIFA